MISVLNHFYSLFYRSLKINYICWLWFNYQYQLPIICQLPGPWCLGAVSFLQSLLTADFPVGFPLWKALQVFQREKILFSDIARVLWTMWGLAWAKLRAFCEKRQSDHPSLNRAGGIDLCIIVGIDWQRLKLFPYVSSASVHGPDKLSRAWSNARLLHSDTIQACNVTGWGNVYRAQAPIHCVLVKRLANSEGDDGGSDAGVRPDGQAFALLADFHWGAGGRCHCNLPQQNIHTCSAHKHS